MKKKVNIKGLLIAGLVGIILVIILNIKTIDKISFKDFIPLLAVLLVFGTKDIKLYLDYKKLIKKGIDLIENNLIWSIDNMIITGDSENANQIFVRNDLLWIEKGERGNENMDRLLEILISDFEYIAKDNQLKHFLKNKFVNYNLYSSDLKKEELLKTELKNYSS
jgi:hypothetical protein